MLTLGSPFPALDNDFQQAPQDFHIVIVIRGTCVGRRAAVKMFPHMSANMLMDHNK